MSCYVNETGMKIKNSKEAIMSISWKDMFHDLRYTSQTNPVYILERYILLYDAKLQRLIQQQPTLIMLMKYYCDKTISSKWIISIMADRQTDRQTEDTKGLGTLVQLQQD